MAQYSRHHLVEPNFRFLVTRVPAGDAPRAHKEEWVGLMLPFLMRNLDGPAPTDGVELVSGDVADVLDGIAVRTDDAIAELVRAGRLAAANYFGQNVREPLLVFESSEGRIVSVAQADHLPISE